MIASATFLLIFLASYCNANDSRHIDLEFEDDTYTNYSEIPKLDDTRIYGPYATRDFYIVLIFGLSALLVNLLGSLYVIYRTYIQLRRVGKNNVPLSLRFPFYIALTDTFLSLVFTANLGYTIIRKLPWPNPACKIFGASVSTLFALNIFLVGLVALTTWSCVCREYYIEFGTYDYRLWGVTLVLSALFFFFSLDQSGQQKFWCAGRHHSPFVPIIMIVFIIIILATILICYIKVLLKIRSNDNMLISSYQRPVEKRALRKLISYIFTFLLQFIPLLTYYFFTLAEIESILLDVLAITTINFGGIGNFVQFAINEGLNSNKLNSPSSTMDQNMQQESSVVSKPIISVTTHEITVVNNINESDLTQNDINDIVCYNNRLPSEPDKNTIDINRGIIDENDLSNNDDDVLTVFDGTNLVSANSQNVLLNDDHDFQEEIKEYTSHCSSS
ncbi:uncharacterized protein OCT59_004417 [Rhizophagus irregularis]|nr:hypothetical protein OCT59_004417 [Rhizophagus irregularis]GBC54210.1 hypothetical protein GLOIN_2v1581775 [Rhizophagus irregularis DAOM 181602=DAOM 197198]CAB4483290.1 unnamed protein product [Rhizophagus irregularis]